MDTQEGCNLGGFTCLDIKMEIRKLCLAREESALDTTSTELSNPPHVLPTRRSFEASCPHIPDTTSGARKRGSEFSADLFCCRCDHLNIRHSYRDQLAQQGCDKGFIWYLVAVLLCVLTWSCWACSNAEPGRFCSTTSQQVDFTSYCLRSFTSINKTCTCWKTLD